MARAIQNSMELAVIKKQALQLCPSDRALLADHLLQSLKDSAVLQSWLSESADRMAAYDRGDREDREASVGDSKGFPQDCCSEQERYRQLASA